MAPQHPTGFFHVVGDRLSDLADDCSISPENQHHIVQLICTMAMGPKRKHSVHGFHEYSSASYDGAQRRHIAPRGGYGPPKSDNGAFYFEHTHHQFEKIFPGIDKSLYENENLRAENLPPDPNMASRKMRTSVPATTSQPEQPATSPPVPHNIGYILGEVTDQVEDKQCSKSLLAATHSVFRPLQDVNTTLLRPNGSYIPGTGSFRIAQRQATVKDKRLQRVKRQMRSEPNLVNRTPFPSSPLSPLTRAGTLRSDNRSPSQEAKSPAEKKTTMGSAPVVTKSSSYKPLHNSEADDITSGELTGAQVEELVPSPSAQDQDTGSTLR